jgi:hypothetical protein
VPKQQVLNLYELVPVRKRDFEARDDGAVAILVPRYGGGAAARILKLFLSKTPVRIHLDAVGSSVWMLCDGEHSVSDIGKSLHEAFGERIEPVYDRLEQFLTQMKRADLIDWKKPTGSGH